MATLQEQLAGVTDIAGLKKYLFNPEGTIRREVNPAWSDEEVAAFGNVVKLAPTGTGATTAPVTAVPTPVPTAPTTPVVTAPVVAGELLPDLQAPFKLKGTEKKQQVVELIKGRTYEGSITLASVDGGGVHLLGLYPGGNGFYNTGKLKKGATPFSFVAPANGPHRISVEANGANVDVLTVTLTLKSA